MTTRKPIGVITAVSIAMIVGAWTASGQGSTGDHARMLAIEAGRETYVQFCAPCHGPAGKGDGPVAPMLVTPPNDLTHVNRRNNGVFPEAAFEAMLTLTKIQSSAHGSTQMPIWGPVFRSVDPTATAARARVVNLLAYLESIQK